MTRSVRLVRAVGIAALATRHAVALAGAVLLGAGVANAGHPIPIPTERMAPWMIALLVGGLVLCTALLVTIIVVLLRRRPAAVEPLDE